VQTVRRDYLDWLMITNERHLRHVLVDFLEHYHRERPHRGLGGCDRETQRLKRAMAQSNAATASTVLLPDYYRAAA
jgi:hypothetical protein